MLLHRIALCPLKLLDTKMLKEDILFTVLAFSPYDQVHMITLLYRLMPV